MNGKIESELSLLCADLGAVICEFSIAATSDDMSLRASQS